MLGQHDRDADVVNKSVKSREDFFCGTGIKSRCWFIEHENPRVRSKDSTDGCALTLAAAKAPQRSIAQIFQPEEVECFLDASAHDVWSDT
jgi:hypothetical protein